MAKFCSACGSAVALAGRSAEYKQVTVLFADVVHSMDIAAEVGAERWREIMTELVSRCAAVVQRYGGTVDQFTGDGVMAVFGAPAALEDHAIRACRSALTIQDEAKALAAEVQRRDDVELLLRVGLNSGEVVAGGIHAGRLGYTAIGEQVGMAQRMESVAQPGGVMLSASTARLVDHIARLGEPERVHIKGKSEPVTAHRLWTIGLRSRGISRPDTSFVGRQRELNTLAAIVAGSNSGHGAVVCVVGPAGIGKSRLVQEIDEIARRSDVAVFSTFSESHAGDVPFYVAARLLRDATGIVDLSGEVARTQVSAQAADASEDDLLLLYDLLDVQQQGIALSEIDPDARRRRLTALISDMWRARTTPALYIIEDAHWIDEASESLFAELLTVVPYTRSTLVLTYRPDYQGPLAEFPGAHTISLEPLSDSDTVALLDELLGSDPSVIAVRALIAERAGGNPFFAQEMVRELADRGVLNGDRGSYRCVVDVTDVAVPATLQATIAARIDRLEPETKRTLNAAAVIGTRLDPDLLSSVVDNADMTALIDSGLVELVAGGPHSECVFRHPLIREVAYESQLKSDRTELHRKFAEVIRQRDPDSADRNAGLIAEHMEAAGDVPAAYAWHMRAGSWLMARDIGAARLCWIRARRLADALPPGFPDSVALKILPRTLLCTTTWRVGNSADQTGFDELRELCVTAADHVSLAAGRSGAMLSLTMANCHRDSARLASEQIAFFDSIEDPMAIFGVMSAAMFAKLHAGEVVEALRVAEKVVELLAGGGSLGNIAGLGSPLAVALVYRAHSRACLGDKTWRADLARAVAIQREVSQSAALVIVVTYGYSLASTNGLLLPDAAALSETAGVLRNAESSGDDIALALAEVAHGLLLTQASPDDRDAGMTLMSKGRDAQLVQRNLLGVAMADIRTAQMKVDSGDVEGAIAIARTTVVELTSSGEMILRGAASAALVTALLRRGDDGDIDEARKVIDQLASVQVDSGFVPNELYLLRMRALLARAGGDSNAYRDFRDRYRVLATSLGFEGHMKWAQAMP